MVHALLFASLGVAICLALVAFITIVNSEEGPSNGFAPPAIVVTSGAHAGAVRA